MSEWLEIKTAIAEIKGEMRAMTEMIRSGDRDSTSGVRLLAQTVENLGKQLVEQRTDLKAAVEKFDERTEAMRVKSERDASAVRVSLENQLSKHEDDDAPHAKTLGARLDAVERRINLALGAVGLLGVIGLPGIYAILKAAGQ